MSDTTLQPLDNRDPAWMDPYINRLVDDLERPGYHTSSSVQLVKLPERQSAAFARLMRVLESKDTFVYRADTGERHHGPPDPGVTYRVQNYPDA